MDISPRLRAGKQLINAYGDGGFRIAGQGWRGSVLVFPDRTVAWPVTTFADATPESFAGIPGAEPRVEILLFGTGRELRPVPRPIREALKAAGIAIDSMDTGAACRTFNVLLGEDRRVAAALIAVE